MNLTTEQLEQYEALRHGVGFVPLVGRSIVEVTGPDRLQILQSFTTNDVKRLSAGQGCEAFVTSPQGKTLGHIFIFCEDGKHIIDTSPEQTQSLIEHFNRYIITEDAFFTDRTAEFTDILVAGPKAAELLSSVTGKPAPTEYLNHLPVTVGDQPVVLRRMDYAGPNSFFVQVATPHAPAVIAALHHAGAMPCDHAAIEPARLEAGFPLFGTDITPENLPQEVGRDAKAISFTKGCYLGQETVARIDAMGHVNRLLVGVQFSADAETPTEHLELLANSQPIGHVTSAAWSPKLQAPLALAYVRRAQAKVGTELSAANATAIVVKLPLNDVV